MSPVLPRRRLLRGALACCLGPGLAGPLQRAQACEFFCPTLRILHPWTRATDADAQQSARLCMVLDEVAVDDRLIGLESPVADGAQMWVNGQPQPQAIDIPIPAGQVTRLDEAHPCALHLVGLKHPLLLGRSYPLTLVFERGQRAQAGFEVDFNQAMPRFG